MNEQTDWKAAARRKVLKLEADTAALSARYRMLADRRADLLLVGADRLRHLASLKDSRIRPQSTGGDEWHLRQIAEVEAQLADFDAVLGDIDDEIEKTETATNATMRLRDSTKKAGLASGAVPKIAFERVRV